MTLADLPLNRSRTAVRDALVVMLILCISGIILGTVSYLAIKLFGTTAVLIGSVVIMFTTFIIIIYQLLYSILKDANVRT